MSVKYYDWTAYHANMRGNKVAIIDLDTRNELTYAQLDQRAERLAAWLQSQGVTKGDRVALLTPNCPEVFEAEFACAKIGAICIPLNWRLTVPELEYILNDSTPKVLIFDQTFSEQAVALQDLCSFAHTLEVAIENASSSYELALSGADEKCEAIECTHDDVATVSYTHLRAHET